jgi:hypothetical protein
VDLFRSSLKVRNIVSPGIIKRFIRFHFGQVVILIFLWSNNMIVWVGLVLIFVAHVAQMALFPLKILQPYICIQRKTVLTIPTKN